MKKLLVLFPLIYSGFNVMCQTYIGRQLVDQYPITSWGTKTYGLTWLPADYNTTTTNYPLIIFLHAGGEVGDGVSGLNNLINAGLPKEIAAGWDPQAVNPADGKTYKFIVVSPQAPTNSGWSYSYTHVVNILPDILKRYRVDPKRIYITGISAGGAGTWSCVTNDANFTQKIAAIIPVSAAGVNNPNVETPNIKYISGKYGVSVWTVCGTKDALYNTAVSYVNTINTANPAPAIPAKLTGMTGLDHVPAVWDTAYKATWRNNALNRNFYEWMLQYQRNVTSPPENKPPAANAGADKNIKLPTNSVTLTGSGSDPDGTISSYLWTKISGPAQFTIVSSAAAQTVVNNLVAGTYQFELKVTDNKFTWRTDTVAVTVTSLINQIPSVNAGQDQSITLPINTVTLSGSAVDSDGTISSYLWNKVGGPAQFTIATSGQPQTLVNNLVQGVYQFELKATDNQGASKTDTVAITVLPPPNKIPVVNAGDDQTITLPVNSVTLSGSASDTDGAITSYQWTKIDGSDQFTIVSPDQPQATINNLGQGIYKFEFKATDNAGASKADTVIITVLIPPPNKLPVANAGDDKLIYLPADNVTLTGSGSDTDGTISFYQWSKVEGPDEFSITSVTNAQTMITGLVVGTYQFELTVTDNDGAIEKDTAIVTVMPPNQPPVANAADDQTITLPVDSITLSGSAADADGIIASYLWSKIDGPDQFTIATTDQLQTLINDLAEGVYQFELTVTDNAGATAMDTVTITVLPAPNQPPVANAGGNQKINLPDNGVTLPGSGIDPDGTIISYLWNKIDGPDEFSIASETEAQTMVTGLVLGTYQFELVITDNDGATGKDTIVITVLPPNQPPVVNAGDDKIITLPVNSVTLSGSASDTDGSIASYLWNKVDGPDQFSILSPDQNQTTISNLVKGVYQFELKVTDNEGAITTDTVMITVFPVPNKLPVANAGIDQTINLPNNSVTLSGSGTDSGGVIISYQWSKIDGPDQFSIATPNQPHTTVSNLAEGVYLFELKAIDDSSAATTDTVKITVLAAPNQPPVAKAGNDQTITFPANSATLSGSGTDADGAIISYRWKKISGPSQFAISDSTITNPVLSNLLAGTYTFRLIVTDNNSTSSTDDVNIIVNPILAGYKIIPALIQAESYNSMSGVQTENTGDAGGGIDVGWIDNNDWMDYNLYVDSTGTYTVNFRVATANTGAKFQLRKSDGTVLTTISLPNTSSYQGWVTLSAAVPLTEGYQTLRIISTTTVRWNYNWIEFVRGVSTGKAIPAKIEAENYDAMQGIQMEFTGDAGGGMDVGWIDNGDWLDYDVNAASAGTYTVNLRVATPNTGAKLQIRKSDGTVLSTVNINRTGGYQTWTTVSTAISIPAGQQTLRIISTASPGWNFNCVQFVQPGSLVAQTTENILQNANGASLQKGSSFEVAPNPVSDKFIVNINSKNTGTALIQVLDMQGVSKKEFKLIKNTDQPQSVSLSSSGLSRGMYIIRVQVGAWSDSKLVLKL